MLATAAVTTLAVLGSVLLVRRIGVERVRTALGDWVDRLSEPGPKKEPNSDWTSLDD
ncbi:MAG: hypothetical protein H6Q89_4157 [Myxococcaceae bacterium]|nr:hypothetical protein [Myxococcaceae bacterium]